MNALRPPIVPTVLVIDDEPGLGQVLAKILRHGGFETLIAEDGFQGCAMARRAFPTLILCDELMPNTGGREVLHQLKSNPATAGIPVVMMGGTDRAGLEDWVQLGAAGFLPKPFDGAELLTQVHVFLPPPPRSAR